MNIHTCTGCGDTHLCPGRTDDTADPGLLADLRAYIADTFEPNPVGCVSSAGAYLTYLHWCTAHGRIAYSQRQFVPAMTGLGYRRIKRSTMRFAGLSWRSAEIRPAKHAAPEPALAR